MIHEGRLTKLLNSHPGVTIVMAVKYLPAEAIPKAVSLGLVDLGENRVDALLEKRAHVKDANVRWHFIGTLQTKKVKLVIHAIDVLHSLDRLKLAAEINKRREQPLPCFIQVNISQEDQKHGVSIEELSTFLEALKAYPMIEPIGLMGMAEDTHDEVRIRQQFRQLKDALTKHQPQVPTLKYLSMGMSNDYHLAIEEGATHIRLGRILLKQANGD